MTSSSNIRSPTRSRCSGTVEDLRGLAFDVRDRALSNSGLLDLPPGYVLRNRMAWPWIGQIRTDVGGLEIALQNGRTERITLVSVACGFAGSRLCLECPRCRRRVCKLYYVNARLVCRKCEVSGMPRSASAAMAENLKQCEGSAVSSATMVNSRRSSFPRSRAACGSAPIRVIVRRWPA
jgi:hypothetical protein